MIYRVNTTFAYDRMAILRRLRISDDAPAGKYAAKHFDQLVEIARENVEITALYTIRENDLDLGSGNAVKDGCEKLAVAFASSTRRIMNVIIRLMDEGRFMDSYLLNELVNDVLFKASEQMNLEIEHRMAEEGLALTARISPGEQGVDMKHQETLMGALKAETELPATLTAGYMIDPEKSIMYAYGAGRGFAGVPVKHDCRTCTFTTCYYRDVT